MNPGAPASAPGGKITCQSQPAWQAPPRAAAPRAQPPEHPSVPVISLVRYLPAIAALVADDEGGHGLIGAAGLHLGKDGMDVRAQHRTGPRGGGVVGGCLSL